MGQRRQNPAWCGAFVVNCISKRQPMRPISQTTTQKLSHCRRDDATLYASLELSQATWLVTSLSPGSERMSKYSTLGGDGAALLGLLRRLQVRAEQFRGGPIAIVV